MTEENETEAAEQTGRPQSLAELKARLLADPDTLAEAVARGLTAAGAVPDWDSGTIEAVLSPFIGIVAATGMPWVGDTGSDPDDANAWVRILPHEYEEVEERSSW